jgi:hypothetical protein
MHCWEYQPIRLRNNRYGRCIPENIHEPIRFNQYRCKSDDRYLLIPPILLQVLNFLTIKTHSNFAACQIHIEDYHEGSFRITIYRRSAYIVIFRFYTIRYASRKTGQPVRTG